MGHIALCPWYLILLPPIPEFHYSFYERVRNPPLYRALLSRHSNTIAFFSLCCTYIVAAININKMVHCVIWDLLHRRKWRDSSLTIDGKASRLFHISSLSFRLSAILKAWTDAPIYHFLMSLIPLVSKSTKCIWKPSHILIHHVNCIFRLLTCEHSLKEPHQTFHWSATPPGSAWVVRACGPCNKWQMGRKFTRCSGEAVFTFLQTLTVNAFIKHCSVFQLNS